MLGKASRKVSCRQGFTLIELLVVVSIIALLVAIMLPAIGKAKIKAGTVVCSTRIRGLGSATLAYMAEFDNRFPINGLLMPKPNVPARYLPGPGVDPRFDAAKENNIAKWRLEYGALWGNMSGPSVAGLNPLNLPLPPAGVAKAFLCPNDTLNRGYSANASNSPLLMQPAPGGLSKVVQQAGQPGYWSYSVNAVLNSLGRFRDNFTAGPLPWTDPMSMQQIRNQSNFIFFVEEDENSMFNDEVFDAPAFGGGDRLTNRHSNGGNLGFADNHVEWVSEVQFNQGGGNASGVTPFVAMQSPWTRPFFPDGGEFANSP